MFTQTWNKYLPVIRILLKRAVSEDQMIRLNTFDFQKAATVRKAGYRFTIEMINGKVNNLIGLPDIAKDLCGVLLSNPEAKAILGENGFIISFDNKYQLVLKNVPVLSLETEESQLMESEPIESELEAIAE